MTPDRIAWYRQQAEFYANAAVACVGDSATGLSDSECAAVDYARLAAHFGRLAQPDEGAEPSEPPEDAQGRFLLNAYGRRAYEHGHAAASLTVGSLLILEKQKNDAASQRIAALEGALEEAIDHLASEANGVIWANPELLTRLRAVLGKDG